MPPDNNKVSTNEASLNGKNVEQHEIDHFSQYKSDWMDPNGTWKILHLMNKVR
jgi:2-polyprenyl-3-methyl-5-hydroxy-6-metoxy-1,4-benzoquinol methylase